MVPHISSCECALLRKASHELCSCGSFDFTALRSATIDVEVTELGVTDACPTSSVAPGTKPDPDTVIEDVNSPTFTDTVLIDGMGLITDTLNDAAMLGLLAIWADIVATPIAPVTGGAV